MNCKKAVGPLKVWELVAYSGREGGNKQILKQSKAMEDDQEKALGDWVLFNK
ncbi:MAG: hypothetical protein WAZ77_10975 [Candidatus Nitrosopolaris sp.]